MAVRIKICGITRLEDALYCQKVGIDALGFVFYPASKRYITPVHAAAIIDRLSPFITTVGLVVNPTVAELTTLIKTVPVNLLQFHGDEPPALCAQSPIPYIKALRLKDGEDAGRAEKDFASARGLLYDSYTPAAYGGTGVPFDWSLLPAGGQKPWILAGGLTPANITRALKITGAVNIDIASGVETAAGIKDTGKIDELLAGVKIFAKI